MSKATGQEGSVVTRESPVKPVLAVGAGRGFGGKSTVLAELAWRAMAQGREVIIADGDARSGTLASMFPGKATRPPSEELPDVKEWISQVLLGMIVDEQGDPLPRGRSAVLDLGGGDRVLQEYGKDLDLARFCEDEGIDPVAIYVLGPEPEDLLHVLSIWEAGYLRTRKTLLVLNEGVIREGKTTKGAFAGTLNDPGFRRMIDEGAMMLILNRLPCMDKVRNLGCGFYAAGDRKKVKALDPISQHMVRKWLADFEESRAAAGVQGWLP